MFIAVTQAWTTLHMITLEMLITITLAQATRHLRNVYSRHSGTDNPAPTNSGSRSLASLKI